MWLSQWPWSWSYTKVKEWINIKLNNNNNGYSRYIKYTGAFLLVLCARRLLYRVYCRYRKYPPMINMPFRLPFLGYFLHLTLFQKYFITEIAKRHGDIVLVPMGFNNNIIYLNDSKLVRQLMSKKAFYNRFTFHNPLTYPSALSLINGQQWIKRKALVQQSLMKFCNYKYIQTQIKEVLKNEVFVELDADFVCHQNQQNNVSDDAQQTQTEGKLWFPAKHISYIAFNVLFTAIFDLNNRRQNTSAASFCMNDEWVAEYVKQIEIRNASITPMFLLNICFPFKLPNFVINLICDHRRNEKIIDELLIHWMTKQSGLFTIDTTQNVLKRRPKQSKEKTVLNNNNDNDDGNSHVYVDILMQEIANKNMGVYSALHDIQLFIYGGLSTIINTAEYGFLLLAKYPKIQEDIYQELQRVMRTHLHRKPSNGEIEIERDSDSNSEEKVEVGFDFAIIHKLHFFRAFIYEMLRISVVYPTGVPHENDTEYKLYLDHDNSDHERDNKNDSTNYYIIPAKSIIHINSHFIHKWQTWTHTNSNDTDTDTDTDAAAEGKAADDEHKCSEDNEMHLNYWLNAQNEFKMNPNFVAFGFGKRDCIGKSLVLKIFYAMFAEMITRYKFSANNGADIEIAQVWGTLNRVDPKIGIRVQKRE